MAAIENVEGNERTRARAAAVLGQRIDGMVGELVANLAPYYGDELTRPSPRREALAELSHAMFANGIQTLANGSAPEHPPPILERVAEEAVRFDQPLRDILRAYSAGQAILWSSWAVALEEVELDAPRRRAVLSHGSSLLFTSLDRYAAWLEESYTAAEARARQTTERRRLGEIKSVLAGRPAEQVLGYDLGLTHLGVVAKGAEPARDIRSLGRHLGAALLAVDVEGDTAWGWCGIPATDDADVQRSLRTFEPQSTSLALGGPEPGPDGFRETHKQAVTAAEPARLRGRRLTLYREVALEALALGDQDSARWFMEHELGPLAARDVRTDELRRTLRAWFEASQQVSSAAASLGVHERTVANRLRAIEQSLGSSVAGRRAELELALRLYDLLTEHPRLGVIR